MASTANAKLVEAISISKEAVAADVAGDRATALSLYQRVLPLFVRLASDPTTSPDVRKSLPAKIKEYEARTVVLQNELPAQRTSPQLPPASSQSQQFSPFDLEFYEEKKDTKQKPLGMEEEALGAARVSAPQPAEARKGKRRGEKSLEDALTRSNTAHELENRGNQAAAFLAYMQALEYYADAAKFFALPASHSPVAPAGVLATINKMMKTDMERAEDLKTQLEAKGNKPSVSHVNLAPEESVLEHHLHLLKDNKDIDLRISLPERVNSTSFWNDKRTCRLKVELSKNVLHCGDSLGVTVIIDNETGATIEGFTVALIQFITSTNINAQGKKSTGTRQSRIGPLNFRHEKRFPLPGPSRFRGRCIYTIPDGIEPTDADNSASFALEYEVAVTLLISNHESLSVQVPVRLYRAGQYSA